MSTEKSSFVQEFEKKYVARLKDREFDFNVLSFQEKVDPKYRRAQIRYIGGGGTGMHNDQNVIKAEGFTLSTMLLPPGSEGPLHLHHDVEEVFFVIKGKAIALIQEKDGEEVYEIPLDTRDCISTPPGVYRGIKNHTDEEALFLVMIGTKKPQLPTYHEGSELEKIRIERQKAKAAAANK
ncbi:cupin domain-containing protein [Shimazuella alba]|uniref:Cupin domain-containing protein n=1 Tax=Shimazuella alba TaxID=2690964 RepID=A0A6I4W0K4_9BACL|nr:cupin domain-containing protein [Shimazuella alba]MXQ55735.1 cupin domain-containing protein [Shimazuella alba]